MASLQDRACGDHHGTDIHSAAYGGFHARGGGCALKEAVTSGEHAGTGEYHMEEGASGRRHYELTTDSLMPSGEEVKEMGMKE